MSKTYRDLERTGYSLRNKKDISNLIEYYGTIKKGVAILSSDCDYSWIQKKDLKRDSAKRVRASQRKEIHKTLFNDHDYDLTADSKLQTDPWGYD